MPWVRRRPTILFHSPESRPVPGILRRWAEGRGFPLRELTSADEAEAIVLRGANCLLFLDGEQAGADGRDLVGRLKSDPFTAIIPAVVLSGSHPADRVDSWFAAGVDEVVSGLFPPAEQKARLDAMLVRTERDVSVHPSTRLPGTTEIERAIRRHLEAGTEFAVCYADLDHFKEFNDRYSYYDGDRVIYILSRILHDVVRGIVGAEGFVGHIGGDDFIFVIPLGFINETCSEILSVFDTLIPLQYNDQDRRAGYFFGKDRRGQLHRVPLMTLSIGIVTNRSRKFAHPAQVSELATEMKSYAKTLPGSVFVVDRRQGSEPDVPPGGDGRDQR